MPPTPPPAPAVPPLPHDPSLQPDAVIGGWDGAALDVNASLAGIIQPSTRSASAEAPTPAQPNASTEAPANPQPNTSAEAPATSSCEASPLPRTVIDRWFAGLEELARKAASEHAAVTRDDC
jgi:hypothetical protein